MNPDELHEYLLNLKNKNSFDVLQNTYKLQTSNIAEYKKTIRQELNSYRANQPLFNSANVAAGRYKGFSKDIVFYSFMEAPGRPKIGEHEYKRLKLSWQSLRKHNTDIEIRFCYSERINLFRDPESTLGKDRNDSLYDKWASLCNDYGVEMYPFHESFIGNEPNAWSIHRWYNLALWERENLNILYLDADTYINDDIQLIFDNYKRDPVYGREEIGFRHDPNQGIYGEDPRFYLDLIDASIMAQGGKTEVQKYCLGVILLNHSIHKLFTPEVLSGYTDLLERIHALKVFYSIPNFRIMDEFALWVLLSRWSLRTSLFGDQDVTQSFLEKKHETNFNPIVLHYTTKDEEKFADWAYARSCNPEFSQLSRSQEEREDSVI
jgi:hypothetical protein